MCPDVDRVYENLQGKAKNQLETSTPHQPIASLRPHNHQAFSVFFKPDSKSK
jgi:hypothetical protein